MAHRFNKLPQTSLREQIVDTIRNAIIQGKLKPGEKIPEQELAEQLGVSRTPIREAIRILEQQGLVQTRPKNGTYIASPDWEEVRDSLHVRIALEELAVRQAAERLTPSQWAEVCEKLQSLLDGMHEAVAQDDQIAATELDIEWHTLLIDAAQNRYLSRFWRDTGLPFLVWSPERELYPFTPERVSIFYSRHQELLASLRERDPDQCAAGVRSHILRKLSDINEWLGEVTS
ncbi:MAG: GntR family transcriptional regulator [Chloroflexi bacterium]|nr:GntR family transcriptional regulator [Chloroflexota bacterium]